MSGAGGMNFCRQMDLCGPAAMLQSFSAVQAVPEVLSEHCPCFFTYQITRNSFMLQYYIRKAERADVPLILTFIKHLADFEKMSDQVVATEELLTEWLFDKQKAEVLFIMNAEHKEVGFALFFHNFSTFLGRAGIYLEDLCILPEYRHQGYGKAMLKELARLTVQRECGRLEWSCLKWNQNALNVYHGIGAKDQDEWVTLRLTGEELQRFGAAD